MKILKYKLFLEQTSNVEEYLNSILDKILNKEEVSKIEKDFLISFKKDNQEEYFQTFKNKIEKERILDDMKVGEYHDIVKISKFTNAKVTKEIYKADDDKFVLSSTSDGWLETVLDKETLIKYMVGEVDDLDFDWK